MVHGLYFTGQKIKVGGGSFVQPLRTVCDILINPGKVEQRGNRLGRIALVGQIGIRPASVGHLLGDQPGNAFIDVGWRSAGFAARVRGSGVPGNIFRGRGIGVDGRPAVGQTGKPGNPAVIDAADTEVGGVGM